MVKLLEGQVLLDKRARAPVSIRLQVLRGGRDGLLAIPAEAELVLLAVQNVPRPVLEWRLDNVKLVARVAAALEDLVKGDGARGVQVLLDKAPRPFPRARGGRSWAATVPGWPFLPLAGLCPLCLRLADHLPVWRCGGGIDMLIGARLLDLLSLAVCVGSNGCFRLEVQPVLLFPSSFDEIVGYLTPDRGDIMLGLNARCKDLVDLEFRRSRSFHFVSSHLDLKRATSSAASR
jgi:hypothetical protein